MCSIYIINEMLKLFSRNINKEIEKNKLLEGYDHVHKDKSLLDIDGVMDEDDQEDIV